MVLSVKERVKQIMGERASVTHLVSEVIWGIHLRGTLCSDLHEIWWEDHRLQEGRDGGELSSWLVCKWIDASYSCSISK